ncbi:MAG: MFS transporter [Gammaproteobacteria bacterium]
MNIDAKQRNKVLLLLFVGVLMGALDIAIVGPAFPAIQSEFVVDSRHMAWIFNIYVLVSLISTPLMAKLSDRFGRRSIYILDVALFVSGSVVVAMARSYPMMIVGRAVQALGSGGILPVAAAVIGDTFPPEKRGGALGLIGAVFGIAFLVGPVLAGFVLKYGTWHWLFLINLPIGLILMVAAARMLPATRPAQRKPFDFKGVLLMSLILGPLAFGITGLDRSLPMMGMGEPLIGGAIMLGLVLIPLFWGNEKRAADPVLQPRLFSSKQMNIAGLLSIGTGMAETSGVFLPSLAVAGLGMTAHEASFWMIPTVIALVIGSPLAGRLLDRIGSKVVVQGGLLMAAVGFFMFGIAGTNMIFFVLGQVLSGFGLSALLGAPLRYVVLNEAGAEQRGAAQGLLSVMLSMGQLSGAALVGAIAASYGSDNPQGFQQGFIAIGVVMTVMTLLALGLKNRAAERANSAVVSA